MNKQTFPIPEGCKAITMEIIDNTIVTTFGPAQTQPEFKRGDVLASKRDGYNICVLDEITNRNQAVEIVGIIDNEITYNENPKYFDYTQSLRHATPEEAQRLWDALAKEGKRWNPETMEVEEIKKDRWRAKLRKDYYSVSRTMDTTAFTEEGHHADDVLYETGNYFRTKEQSQRAAEKLKQALAEFWKEELK